MNFHSSKVRRHIRRSQARKNLPHRSCRLERAHLERPICNHTKGLHVEKRNMQPCIHSLSKKAKIVGCTCQIVGSHLVRNLDWGASISSDGAIKVLPVFFSKIKEQTNTKKNPTLYSWARRWPRARRTNWRAFDGSPWLTMASTYFATPGVKLPG